MLKSNKATKLNKRKIYIAIYMLIIMILNNQNAKAHAILDRQKVTPGEAYHLSINIGHGCSGAETTALTVTIPDGIIITKIDENKDFKQEAIKENFGHPWKGPATLVDNGIKQIKWSDGKLPDKMQGSFGFEIYASDELKIGQVLAFPVIQACQQDERKWTEQAETIELREKLKSPAPYLTIANREQADIELKNARTRVTPHGATVAGGYITIQNKGTKPDRLIGANVSIADRVEIHEMKMTDGIMQMRLLENGLEIPPGENVELKSGSFHLMFINPKREFMEDEVIDGFLIFEKAGSIQARFKVEGMAGGHHNH
jgi:periplasmic copper chaperone A